MKLAMTQTGTFRLGALLLIVSMIITGLMTVPSNASAYWWSWGGHHAHAQDDDNNDDSTVTVTIQKYIDGEKATSESADGNAFAMNASWDDPDGIGAGSGEFELSANTSPKYKAVTAELQTGADYNVSEKLDGDLVGSSCDADHPYALVGYSSGTSTELAVDADVSTAAPSFTDLSENQYVIVWNKSCDDDNGNATSSGSISGEVTGGSSEDPGELAVTSIDAQKTTAVANGEFADGWQYVFNITVPTDEPDLAMKFANWMQTNGDHTIPVGGNMRISSEQASSTSTVVLTAENAYSSPDLHMIEDLNEDEDGLQVQVLVEVAVPSDTYNGTYSTQYGIRTLP
jgi:hypothetical protein